MTATTAPTAEQITATIKALTPKGRETMTAIGLLQVSFFDQGVVEGSGSWGEVLTGDLGHRSSGVLVRLMHLGLWEVTHQEDDEYKAGAWWSLTALGAAVAQALANPITNHDTTNKENTVTENTTAKPAAAKEETKAKAAAKKPAAAKKITTEGRAYKTPKGYEVKWQHGGHDLLRKVDDKVNGPAWYTACNAHGDLKEAASAKEAETFGVLKTRSTWCKGDHKPAAKKTATKAAAAKAPAKAAAKKTTGKAALNITGESIIAAAKQSAKKTATKK